MLRSLKYSQYLYWGERGYVSKRNFCLGKISTQGFCYQCKNFNEWIKTNRPRNRKKNYLGLLLPAKYQKFMHNGTVRKHTSLQSLYAYLLLVFSDVEPQLKSKEFSVQVIKLNINLFLLFL